MTDYAEPRSGMSTTDNERFLRNWFEVELNNINFTCLSIEEAKQSQCKWYPYNKGGEFRKWYGNNSLLVNWANDGAEIKHWVVNNPKDPKTTSWSRRIFGTDRFFQKGITWSSVCCSAFNCRCYEEGFIFDSGANGLFTYNDEDRYYIAGFLNTNFVDLVLSIINPTINTGPGTVGKLPTILSNDNKEIVVDLVKDNVNMAKKDWDSFETSWDFKKHPLI